MANRKVKRVLVMLDYGDDDPNSGEVFDLTALALELGNGCEHRHADIRVKVAAESDYSKSHPWPLMNTVSWQTMINFHSSGDTGHLDDAINASMPDSLATEEMRKKLKRLNDRAKKIGEDIQAQKLRDAAAVRHQHPIARVRETALLTLPPEPASQTADTADTLLGVGKPDHAHHLGNGGKTLQSPAKESKEAKA